MIDLQSQWLELIRSILRTHVPDAEVRAFGSRVTGKPKSYSDLDLAIVGAHKLSLQTLGDLRQAFQESDLPIRVDVVDWHGISEEFREVIGKKNEMVQEGKNS